MSWSLLNSVVLRFGSLAVGIAMARILVPEDYGLFAVGITVLTVLQSMNELGTSVAVVRWKGDVARPARTATTLAYAVELHPLGLDVPAGAGRGLGHERPRCHHAAAGPVLQRPHRRGVVDPERPRDP